MKGLLLAVTVLLTTLSATPSEPAVWQDCNAPAYIFSDEEVEALARLLYGEALNCPVEEQAAIVWCVLNRMDSDDPYWPDTLLGVVTQPTQFFGYSSYNPVLPELVEVVEDVFMRYNAERSGIKSVGRVLPREYLYFSGDGSHNQFTTVYASNDAWNWTLRSPYRDD